jgi:hypothetical protein
MNHPAARLQGIKSKIDYVLSCHSCPCLRRDKLQQEFRETRLDSASSLPDGRQVRNNKKIR